MTSGSFMGGDGINMRTINGTKFIDPGGSVMHHNISALNGNGSLLSTFSPSEMTNPEIRMTKLVASYTLVIIMLSLTVILAIIFVLFGLFMKAGAYTRSDPRLSTLSTRRLSFLKGEMDIDDHHTGFGPSGFGGYDDI